MVSSNDVKSLYRKKQELGNGAVEEHHIAKMGEVDQFSQQNLDQLKILYAGMPSFETLNVFRELRTQLLQKANKQNFVCMVSSVCPGGGASHIARNLAAVFALDKAKTSLLIDTNLYSPSANELILGEPELGITDYLGDDALDVKDVVYATGVPRVRAIPIGSNSEAAAEYFSSKRMLRFVDEIRNRYSDRFVFIDSPPIVESSEARILAEVADMVVLVVPHGMVSIEVVSLAVDIVEKNKLAGLIYNN